MNLIKTPNIFQNTFYIFETFLRLLLRSLLKCFSDPRKAHKLNVGTVFKEHYSYSKYEGGDVQSQQSQLMSKMNYTGIITLSFQNIRMSTARCFLTP
jgi:hypothetical protein